MKIIKESLVKPVEFNTLEVGELFQIHEKTGEFKIEPSPYPVCIKTKIHNLNTGKFSYYATSLETGNSYCIDVPRTKFFVIPVKNYKLEVSSLFV